MSLYIIEDCPTCRGEKCVLRPETPAVLAGRRFPWGPCPDCGGTGKKCRLNTGGIDADKFRDRCR